MEDMRVEREEAPIDGTTALAQRLRRRRKEIERALARVCAAERHTGVGDPVFSAQVDATFAAVTDFYLDCIEAGENTWDAIPAAAVEQARVAARSGISLDEFLVRLISAQTLLNEFVLQESRDLTSDSLSRVQALQGSLLLRFASGLAGEYKQEEGRMRQSATRRQNAVVDRLLWGAPAARHEVGYPLEMWHVGLVVRGARARDAARALAETLGTALLAVPREKGTVWAWLGSRRKISSQSVQDAVAERGGLKAKFAVGEPGRDVEGWRSTHFEARATLAVAVRRSADVTCFSEVAPEAIALQSPDLARSLQATYLAPLSGKRKRGSVLRQTLRAYFASGRNASSAAAILRVSRRTVENRLRLVEQELGRPLTGCGAELELALRLEDLDPEQTAP
jgi:hypothetical protein